MRWLVSGLLCAGSIVAWVVCYDDSTKGTAVLGGYLDRSFLLCVFSSYLAVMAALAMLVRPGKRAWLRIALVHLGVILPVGLAEAAAGLRWVDFRGMGIAEAAPRQLQRRGGDVQVRWVGYPDIDVAGKADPDLVAILGAESPPVPFVYRTDANGLRNPRAKPDARVHCIGDSVLVAGLVPIEKTVTSLLERRLGVPVQNVSEVGYSPQEAVLRLQSLPQELDRRLVVHFFFEGNDLRDSYLWRRWLSRPPEKRLRTRGPVKALLRMLHGPKRAAGRRRVGRFASSVDVHFLYDAGSMRAHVDEFDHICRAFRAARTSFAGRGAAYAIVFVPAKLTVLHRFCEWEAGSDLASPDAGASQVRDRLREFCAGEAIALKDLTEPLQAVAGRGELPYFAADTHLNAVGHAAMAAALGEWVKGLIPSG